IEPKDKLFKWLEKLSKILANEETLFIIDDIIADENLDKKRQPLLDLAISGRHRSHSLWLLTQSYTAIPKNLRRQKKQLFLWYPAERSDFKLVDEETNILP
ncbi:ATPase/DNA packaging protein, partial [Acinetobacter baumannii]|uniref:ATPase/DNA packaging protein n=1 Tax=Acinetobacter baumannii TaxID=470 RepID=UPI00148F4255